MKYVTEAISEEVQVLNNQQFTHIAPITNLKKFPYIRSLYLSHNAIQSLKGIEVFSNLEQLSLSFNQLMDVEELYWIKERKLLRHLSVNGNFLDRHPDYKRLLLDCFPNLMFLNGVEITFMMREGIEKWLEIESSIIPFMNYVNLAKKDTKRLMKLEDYKDLYNLALTCNKLSNIDFFNEVIEIKERFEGFYCSEEDSNNISRTLYDQIIEKLRSQGKHNLDRYLNYQVLKSNPQLFKPLKRKVKCDIEMTEAKYMEYAAELLLREELTQQIMNDKYEHFIKLQHSKSDIKNFPLFPLNEDYLNALYAVMIDTLKPIKTLYDELKQSIIRVPYKQEPIMNNQSFINKWTIIEDMIAKKIINQDINEEVKKEFVMRLKRLGAKKLRAHSLNLEEEAVNDNSKTVDTSGYSGQHNKCSYYKNEPSLTASFIEYESSKMNKYDPMVSYQNHLADAKAQEECLVKRDYRRTKEELNKDIDRLIATVSKMKRRCVKKLKENKVVEVKKKEKICSIDCKTKIPRYLQQKRLAPNIAMYPSHRTKTLSAISKSMLT